MVENFLKDLRENTEGTSLNELKQFELFKSASTIKENSEVLNSMD